MRLLMVVELLLTARAQRLAALQRTELLLTVLLLEMLLLMALLDRYVGFPSSFFLPPHLMTSVDRCFWCFKLYRRNWCYGSDRCFRRRLWSGSFWIYRCNWCGWSMCRRRWCNWCCKFSFSQRRSSTLTTCRLAHPVRLVQELVLNR